MKSALALVLLVGCSAPSRGPAWPERHARDDDGGQSLAPTAAAKTIAAAASAADDDDEPAAPAAASPGTAEPAGPAINPFTPPAEEPITTEEIVIEVED